MAPRMYLTICKKTSNLHMKPYCPTDISKTLSSTSTRTGTMHQKVACQQSWQSPQSPLSTKISTQRTIPACKILSKRRSAHGAQPVAISRTQHPKDQIWGNFFSENSNRWKWSTFSSDGKAQVCYWIRRQSFWSFKDFIWIVVVFFSTGLSFCKPKSDKSNLIIEVKE